MNVQDLLLFATAGVALGVIYFALLAVTVNRYVSRSTAASIISLYLLRLAIAVAGFWFIAQQGPVPLIAALAGFMAARLLVQRQVSAA